MLSRRRIDDEQILERYLADQLSEADRAAFESYCLRHPEVLDELEALDRLKFGLRSMRNSGELGGTVQRVRAPRKRTRRTVAQVPSAEQQRAEMLEKVAAVAHLAAGDGFRDYGANPGEIIEWVLRARERLLREVGKRSESKTSRVAPDQESSAADDSRITRRPEQSSDS